ncbi:MAG: hypothetical protein M3N53_05800 [Actinomycetota bacterium]|nr:hypothetical protein [Actinomycetota bacterium]
MKPTRIALFAADRVGLEIAGFIGGRSELTMLILDTADRQGLNQQIIEISRLPKSRILYGGELNTADTIEQLRRADLDLGVLAWWPHIIRSEIIQIPRIGILNFHPSFLPYGRGKDPNFWSIVEETPFGVTLHFIDPGVDTGPIAFQREIPVTWEDTGGSLYQKALREMILLFKESYAAILEGRIPRVPQDDRRATSHKRAELHDASRIHLDASYSGREVLNLIRARTFPPHPAAWFVDGEEMFEVRVEIRRMSGS